MITIRKALPSDYCWIDSSYKSINFQLSDYSKERVVLGLWNSKRAGVARLIPLDKQSSELGGIFVSDDFRGKGIARQLVNHLLKGTEKQLIYCIPFEHLIPFYLSCGFIPVSSVKDLPCALIKKLDWCKNIYQADTSILSYSALK